MQQEKLIIENPVTCGTFTVTVVSKMVIRWPELACMAAYFAEKHPVYLLIDSDTRKQALTLEGIEIPRQELEYELIRYGFNQTAN